VDGDVVEYDACGTSHIEPLPDGSYCYCTLYHDRDWAEYFPYAEAERRRCVEHPSIDEDEDVAGLYFITCLPWLHYTALTQPTGGGDESNPRITWGKYEPDARGRLMLPVTALVHHALADGLHLGQFYANLDRIMDELIHGRL
jgi:chloramphenicol O-acetyltransferase type A